MFGKLDRYLARSFMEPFLVAVIAITGLYVVADAFDHVDSYLREASGILEALSRIGQVYALRIPTFLSPVVPVAMLIAAAYGVSQLTAQNEINAMRAGGLSYWRILSPIYAMAALAAILALANRELVVPRVEQMAAADVQVWTGKGNHSEQVGDYLESERTHFNLWFNVATRHVHNLLVLKKMPDDATLWFRAESAEPVSGGWLLHDAKGNWHERVWRTNLRAKDLEMRLLPPEVRPMSVLRRAIRHASDDNDRRLARLYYAERLTYPFIGLVLIALGVPFVIGHEKIQRSRMLGIGICVVICLVFYTVQYISIDLGQQGHLPPEIAAWLPIVLFGAVGLYLLEALHG